VLAASAQVERLPQKNFTSNVDLVLPNALAILLEYLFRLPCNPHVPFPCLHACIHASIRSIIDRGKRIQRMQSRLACIDCCPACCHRHHSCSGPAIAFTDGRAARSHRSTGNLSLSIHPRDNDFINVDSAMVPECPALRGCRKPLSSGVIV
jgi:hypothetical protein